MACRLLKSLYGLKQAPKQWSIKLREILVHNEYSQSKFDYSMFQNKEGTNIVVLLVYVNDLLITCNNKKLIAKLKSDLECNFKMKDLGELRYFIGLEILRNS